MFVQISDALGLSLLLNSKNDGRLVLGLTARDSAIALGIYLVDSDAQRWSEKLLPEMKKILRALPAAKWITSAGEQSEYYLPVAEHFAFAFIALYNEVILLRNKPNEIAEFADDFLSTLGSYFELLRSHGDQTRTSQLLPQPALSATPEDMCKYVIPSLVGLLRAFGRVFTEKHLHVSDMVLVGRRINALSSHTIQIPQRDDATNTRRTSTLTFKRTLSRIQYDVTPAQHSAAKRCRFAAIAYS